MRVPTGRLGVVVVAVAAVCLPAAASAAAAPRGWVIDRHRLADPSRLTGVVMPARDDGWAIGTLADRRGRAVGGLVLHWNGVHWRVSADPAPRRVLPVRISASSPSNVWISGADRNSTAPALYRFDGSAWHRVPLPPDKLVDNELVATGRSQAWIVTFGACSERPGGVVRCQSLLAHWTGRTWATFTLTGAISGFGADSAGDVWAVGSLGGASGKLLAYRWTGAAWSAVKLPEPTPAAFSFSSVAVQSSKDVWIGGPVRASGGRLVDLHWDGESWQEVSAHGASNVVVADGHGGAWVGPWEHWTGRTWVRVPTSYQGLVRIRALARVPGTSRLVAVGAVLRSASTTAALDSAIGWYPGATS